MREELIRLLAELFPAIRPESAKGCIEAIRQHGNDAGQFATLPIDGPPLQGDILGPIAVYETDEEGQPSRFNGQAMVLSNSCDAENDESVVVCPGMPSS